MPDKKYYFIERLTHEPGKFYLYAWIDIYYKSADGKYKKLREEYYADLRHWLCKGRACEISPMGSSEILWEKRDIPVDKKTLRQCITEFFKTIGYEKISKRQIMEAC